MRTLALLQLACSQAAVVGARLLPLRRPAANRPVFAAQSVLPRVTTSIEVVATDGIAGYTTYRMSATLANPDMTNLYALYGNAD